MFGIIWQDQIRVLPPGAKRTYHVSLPTRDDVGTKVAVVGIGISFVPVHHAQHWVASIGGSDNSLIFGNGLVSIIITIRNQLCYSADSSQSGSQTMYSNVSG